MCSKLHLHLPSTALSLRDIIANEMYFYGRLDLLLFLYCFRLLASIVLCLRLFFTEGGVVNCLLLLCSLLLSMDNGTMNFSVTP
jgi:hypothetical protein